MARSKYIYMIVSGIFQSNDFEIHGLFTVKHEAVKWMERLIQFDKYGNNNHLRIIRTGDGYHYDPILLMTRKDLEDELGYVRGSAIPED